MIRIIQNYIKTLQALNHKLGAYKKIKEET